MGHGPLYLAVGAEPGVVVVEGGEHVVGVDPVDELDLGRAKARAIDRKSSYADPPEGHGIERPFNEDNASSSHGGVVEEELANVYSSGVSVLWPIIRFQGSTNDSENSAICSP